MCHEHACVCFLFFPQEKLKLITVLGAGLLCGTALAVIIPEGVHALYEEILEGRANSVAFVLPVWFPSHVFMQELTLSQLVIMTSL